MLDISAASDKISGDLKGLKNQLENVEYVLAKYGQTQELIPKLNTLGL